MAKTDPVFVIPNESKPVHLKGMSAIIVNRAMIGWRRDDGVRWLFEVLVQLGGVGGENTYLRGWPRQLRSELSHGCQCPPKSSVEKRKRVDDAALSILPPHVGCDLQPRYWDRISVGGIADDRSKGQHEEVAVSCGDIKGLDDARDSRKIDNNVSPEPMTEVGDRRHSQVLGLHNLPIGAFTEVLELPPDILTIGPSDRGELTEQAIGMATQ
jgi:hypothetical protein